MKRAAELRAAALQRKQQEQQARQQQQNLLRMNKKKVQNAIKTQQRKVAVYKPPVVNPAVTYKPTVTAQVPLGALRRTLPVVRPTVPSKLPGIQPVGVTQMRPQIAPRTTIMNTATTPTPYIQRLQPKPQVTQASQIRIAAPTSVASQITRPGLPATTGAYTGNACLLLS